MARERNGVTVIFYTKNKRVLMGLRSKECYEPETWYFVAGGKKESEDIRDCALRESIEEVGYMLDKDNLVFFEKNTSAKLKINNDFFLYFLEDEFEPELNWEHEQFKWFPIDELPDPLHPVLQDINFLSRLKNKIKNS